MEVKNEFWIGSVYISNADQQQYTRHLNLSSLTTTPGLSTLSDIRDGDLGCQLSLSDIAVLSHKQHLVFTTFQLRTKCGWSQHSWNKFVGNSISKWVMT